MDKNVGIITTACVAGTLLVYGLTTLRPLSEESFTVPPHIEKRMIQLDRAAIEAAYQEQVTHLFGVWMKDSTGQPGRAVHGVENARRAFVDSIKKIEERERAQGGKQ